MDKEEFNKKWKELKEKKQLEAKYKDIGIISKLSFKEVTEIIFITFDVTTSEQEDDNYREKLAKVKTLIKTFNMSCDVEYDSIFGLCPYNAVFLTELHKIIPIKEIELGVVLEFPKKI